MPTYPFRLGTTSYIIPDELVANARYLAGRVDDMELILFDREDGSNNFPDAVVAAELRAIAATHGLSYTVHLPLDLRLGPGGDEDHLSLRKARQVIECTLGLEPWAYVMHLDGREILAAQRAGEATPAMVADWQVQALRALELVAGWVNGYERLALENVEHYPLDFTLPVLARAPVSRCVDIGHLWVDGHDPLPFLRSALPRTRVIHMHGLAERDHKSLAHMPREKLNAVFNVLLEARYAGVVTLEVFGEDDFDTSLTAVAQAIGQGAGE